MSEEHFIVAQTMSDTVHGTKSSINLHPPPSYSPLLLCSSFHCYLWVAPLHFLIKDWRARRASIQSKSAGSVIELFHQFSVSIRKKSFYCREIDSGSEELHGRAERRMALSCSHRLHLLRHQTIYIYITSVSREEQFNLRALSGGNVMNCIYPRE